MGAEAATLEAGFEINVTDAFGSLRSLDDVIGKTAADAVRQFTRIENASRGAIDMSANVVSMKAFGSAATRELESVRQATVKAEQAGERFAYAVAQQSEAYGKSRSELRGMKAETLALAAEQKGLIELAGRIRAAEADLYAKEFQSARQARQAAEEAAEAKERDAAAVAVQAQAIRDAAAAHALFEAAAKRGIAILREQEAAERAAASAMAASERAAAAAVAAAQSRADAEARVNAQLLERSRIDAALERSTGLGALPASSAGAPVNAASSALVAQLAQEERSAAAAAKQMAEEHGRLAAMIQASHDAEVADAAAAERLREATDPLYAVTKRLNAEIAESTRLYHTGATAPAEYARQQEVLEERLRNAGQASESFATGMGRGNFALRETALQLPDIISGFATGQKPMQIFFQQGGQIVQIAMMAQGGLKGFAAQIGALALRFAPLIAVAGTALAAFELLKNQVSDDKALKTYADSLGLTHRELKKLGDVSVTTGDLLSGLGKTISERAGFGNAFDGFGEKAQAAARMAFTAMVDAAAGYYAAWAGSYNGIIATWRQFPAALGDLVIQGANKALEGVQWLVNKSIDAINALGGNLSHVDLGQMKNAYAGAGAAVATTFADEFKRSYGKAKAGIEGFVSDVAANTMAAAQARLKKKADEIIADRTPKKPKEDTHAEALARDAAATEAQIKNLYKLADAYGVSGAAALIAEAREKAESSAIKGRADIEAAVERQVRLAIAQRVADAAKATAATDQQASIQSEVNAQVQAGLVPASQANDLVQRRIAMLPLLSALLAATQIKDAKGSADALAQVNARIAAEDRLTAAKTLATANTTNAANDNQLESLRAELSLVGATDAARVHELATIKAKQDAEAAGLKVGTAAYDTFTGKIVAVADAQQRVTEAQRDFNEQLRFTAEIGESLATSLEKAFGRVGGALGDTVRILTSYGAKQAEIDRQVRDGSLKQSEGLKQTADLQLTSLIGITDAAKNLFKEHSKGYQAMAAAEKALTILQLARTAVDVAGGAARMFASLGPLAFPAVAAMIGVMASLGFSSGGGSSSAPVTNSGQGTVLGDGSAKSDSIARSIDALKDVDTLTANYSRDMLASLRNIDSQIGNLASLLVRTGALDASTAGVQTGFKTSGLGNALGHTLIDPTGLLSKIPVLGDLVGAISGVIKSLFGTKTKIVGNGIFSDPQALSAILSGGFDASSYADIQKTKKFLGVSTSKKVKTQYGDLDDSVERQFGLILKSFDDAITAAAGPLGLATSGIAKQLDAFVVDIGKVDLSGLSGEQIQEKLQNVFGAVGDKMAEAAIPGLEKFQKVGEGYLETLTRVASTVEAVTNSFDLLGQSAGAAKLGIDGSMNLAGRFDSTSDFQSAINTYFQDFYTDAEQTAAKTAQLGRVFASLGVSMPDTIAGFRQLVEAQDLSTAAGQQTYATLLKVAPAFSELETSLGNAASAADILRERQDLQRQLLEAQGDTAAIRAADLQAIDASNRALQQQVWATLDAKAAADAAAQAEQALASTRENLEGQLLQLQGDTAAIRARELAALDPSLRALQQRIYTLTDEQAATQAATQAAQEAAQAAAQVAQERTGLETTLLQLQGNTAELRARELAALDPTNRALQQLIYSLQDQQSATAAAAQAASDAAQKEQAIASERNGLMQQLYEATGDTAALRAAQLATLDPSNRALQQQIWAVQDAKEAADAAKQLADAWSSIGDSIAAEVARIRGLTDASTTTGGFASLQGQFNAAVAAAQGGDQTAAKNLPDLSKALLDAAAAAATSRQELARIEAQTAAALERTQALIASATGASSAATSPILGTASNDNSAAAWWATFAGSSGGSASTGGSDLAAEVRSLRAEMAGMRADNNRGHATTADRAGKGSDVLDRVSRRTGGDALAVQAA